MDKNICLGIDFGTTNSCLSIWLNNKPVIVEDYDGSNIIPTIIEINSYKKIIGKEAYIRKGIFEKINKNTFLVYEIKKLLGKKYSEINNKELLGFDIQTDENDNILIVDTLENKKYFPEEIATHIFLSLKNHSEKFLSKKLNFPVIIKDTILTVPANFNKNQRELIKKSAEYANLNIIRVINEPTAAAICYGLGKNSNMLNILIFDFGGGTLDISILNINEGVYEVLGSCGNNNLGGSDFDLKIMEYCVNEFINKYKLNYDSFVIEIKEDNLQKLKYLCEQTKIFLSENIKTKINIKNFYNNYDLEINFTREDFNRICADLIRIIIKPIDSLLDDLNIKKEEINEIIMVGGMSRIPIIRYNIEKFFNKDVNYSINPDTVVSIGAAIYGYMLTNNCSIDEKLLLIDRTVLSIGVEVSGGLMNIIIPKNSIIPIKKQRKYTTDTDFIDNINIKIYEGERKFTKDNILIGDFNLTGIEKEKRGLPEIQISFEIDSNGIINIKAEDLNNPLNKKYLKVSGNKQNLTKEQIDEIILKAKEMDEIDKLDKMKKESYLSLIDDSLKILENIKEILMPINIKDLIENNVNEILNWLKSNNYMEIEIEKYKELLHDYKINYSIYIIKTTSNDDLECLNEDEIKGIEIWDDNNSKKYNEQINYFRNIIDEYDYIKKQIKVFKYIENNNLDLFNKLENSFNLTNQYANDIIIKFFTDINLDDNSVNEYVNEMKKYNEEFKKLFDDYNLDYNIISKLINKIKKKEEEYLLKLENISDNKNTEIIDNINNKLDEIIEYNSILYKFNSGYITFEDNDFKNMIKKVEEILN